MTTMTARSRGSRATRLLPAPRISHPAARPGRARDALAASASGGVLVSRTTTFR